MKKPHRACTFTFINDKADGLMLSINLLDGGHMFIAISANQAALALSQLADYYADQARDKYPPEVPAFAEEVQPPCDV